jgi:hypothetical protein
VTCGEILGEASSGDTRADIAGTGKDFFGGLRGLKLGLKLTGCLLVTRVTKKIGNTCYQKVKSHVIFGSGDCPVLFLTLPTERLGRSE